MTDVSKTKTVTVKTWLCDVCRHASFLDYNEACQHEKQCNGKPVQSEKATIRSLVSKEKNAPITEDFPSEPTANSTVNSVPTVVFQSKTQRSESTSSQQIAHQTSAKSMPKFGEASYHCSQVSDNEDVVIIDHENAVSCASSTTPNISSLSSRKGKAFKNGANQSTLTLQVKTKPLMKPKQGNESQNKKQRQNPIMKMFSAATQQDRRPLDMVEGRIEPALEQDFTWEKEVLAENASAAFQIKMRLSREREQEKSRKRQKKSLEILENSSSSQLIDENVHRERSSSGQLTDENVHREHSVQKPLMDEFVSRETSLSMNEDLQSSIVVEKFYLRRQQQRDKDLKRQRIRQESKPDVLVTSVCAKQSKEEKKELLRVRKARSPAPRYPSPSHIVCSATQQQAYQRKDNWVADLAMQKSGERRTATPYLGSVQFPETTNYRFVAEGKQSLTVSIDSLHAALSKIFRPPNPTDMNGCALLVDKYEIKTIPDDVCGQRNRFAAEKMLKFVKDWKVERQKSHERRKKLHLALSKSRRIKRKRRPAADDDLWGDDKLENDELCSVCLVTGPLGSGKSNLVHAVARQSGCTLLEINTTERRGGQNLRRAIEEATRSHSSLSMLQQREIDHLEESAIVNSDSEEYDDQEGSSLVVVLIDEVENLFDEDGDSGFWAALTKVSSKSRSPIFLTSSTLPMGLLDASIRFTHITTFCAEPAECAVKMSKIMAQENFCLRNDSVSNDAAANDKLSRIAELCRCEIRCILNELELFRFSSAIEASSLVSYSYEVQTDRKPLWSPCFITSIEPKWVPFDRPSIITIKGQNFKTLISMLGKTSKANKSAVNLSEVCLDVTVSGRSCLKARVLDDSTIIAVCPPYRLDEIDHIGRKANKTKGARYANVSVKSTSKLGAVSCSCCLGAPFLANDNAIFPALSSVNLEYNCPPRHQSDEDALKVKAATDVPIAGAAMPDNNVLDDMIHRGIKEITDKSFVVDDFCASHDFVVDDRFCHEVTVINKLAETAELISDAALFEDFEFFCLPLLSGPVRGFGAALVDNCCNTNTSSIKTMQKPTSKPPSEERLYATGWKDNAYFYGNNEVYSTIPTTIRERRLLSQSELTRENIFFSDAAVDALRDLFDETDSPALNKASEPIENASKSNGAAESMFLPAALGPAFTMLPTILRNYFADPFARPFLDNRVLLTRKTRFADASRRWLDCLFDDEAKVRMCGSGLNCQPHPASCPIDNHLSLDHLPMLRIMGLLEQNAEQAFEKAFKNEDLEVLPMRRRQTRSSKIKRSRLHYFESFSPLLRRGDIDLKVKELGSEMASSVLGFQQRITVLQGTT